jgi:hypothetical protein
MSTGEFGDTFFSFLWGAAAVLGCIVLYRTLKRWRKGEKVFTWQDSLKSLETVLWMVILLALLLSQDLVKLMGWPEWAGFVFCAAAAGLLMLPSFWIHKYIERAKQKRSAGEARTNPDFSNAGGAAAPPVGIGFGPATHLEGLKIVAVTLLPIAVLTALSFWILSLDKPWTVWVTLSLCLGVPLFILLGRWPGNIQMRAEIDIMAPLDRVWAEVNTHETNAPSLPLYAAIVKLDGSGRRFAMRVRDLSSCPDCGWPKGLDAIDHEVVVEVLDSLWEQRHVTRVHPAASGGMWFVRRMFKAMDSETVLTPIPSGVRVRSTCTLVSPAMFIAFSTLFMNTSRQSLEFLKAYLEGTPLPPEIQQMQDQVDAIRRSEKICACGHNSQRTPLDPRPTVA